MPFTVSHAAAVLPVHRLTRLPLTALMVGSMAPDFGYFFSHEPSRALTHSFAGLFIFSLPVGLLVGRAAIAIVLGAVTHLLWDSFTHRGTFVTDAAPALLGPTPGLAWLPIYHLLHALSSVVGLVILFRWSRHLHRQPAKSLIRPYRIRELNRVRALWVLLMTSMLGGLLDWLPYVHAGYDAQVFSVAVGSISGFSSRGVASRSACGSTRGAQGGSGLESAEVFTRRGSPTHLSA